MGRAEAGAKGTGAESSGAESSRTPRQLPATYEKGRGDAFVLSRASRAASGRRKPAPQARTAARALAAAGRGGPLAAACGGRERAEPPGSSPSEVLLAHLGAAAPRELRRSPDSCNPALFMPRARTRVAR